MLFLAGMAGACSPGFNSGFENHNYDLGAHRVGTRQTITIVIDYDRPDRVMQRCKAVLPATEAGACAAWVSDPAKLNDAGREFMQGADCRIIAPPNRSIMAHELLRCAGREDYKVGIMHKS